MSIISETGQLMVAYSGLIALYSGRIIITRQSVLGSDGMMKSECSLGAFSVPSECCLSGL